MGHHHIEPHEAASHGLDEQGVLAGPAVQHLHPAQPSSEGLQQEPQQELLQGASSSDASGDLPEAHHQDLPQQASAAPAGDAMTVQLQSEMDPPDGATADQQEPLQQGLLPDAMADRQGQPQGDTAPLDEEAAASGHAAATNQPQSETALPVGAAADGLDVVAAREARIRTALGVNSKEGVQSQ
jgi:hypothetical protein